VPAFACLRLELVAKLRDLVHRVDDVDLAGEFRPGDGLPPVGDRDVILRPVLATFVHARRDWPLEEGAGVNVHVRELVF